MPEADTDRRAVIRDFEACLVALREALGDVVVADPAGTVAWRPSAAAELPSSAARPFDRPAARPPAAPARAPAPPSAPSAPAAAAPPVVQTSFLSGDAPAPPPSPGLRRGRPFEPGVIEFRALPDIVRAPCQREVRAEALRLLDEQVQACTRCALHLERNSTVFGTGSPCARVCFVGEGPGAEEDRRGEPFVGRAGLLLDKIIAAMKLRRADVYICNTVKCRPPENRTPYPDEMECCAAYLRGQLETVAPQVLVALGRPAAQALLGVNRSLGELRGRMHRHRGIPVMVTYHPAYLLRNPAAKKDTWEDVQQVMRHLAEHPDPVPLPAGHGR